jgi:histidine triad (HIT) family protein
MVETRDPDCLFCKIAAGELNTPFLVETDDVVAFADIAPQAPTHVLVVPRRHISSASALNGDDAGLLSELVAVANQVAKEQGVDQSGYRILTNVGDDAGQTVHHLHLHVLGGRPLATLG